MRYNTQFNYFDQLLHTAASGCMVWKGSRDSAGYGQIRHNGKMTKAHRVAWMRRFGPIPKGLWICHHCDNPPCCNADHLFAGTAKQNTWDSILKKRAGIGRNSVRMWSKLTETQVAKIKASSETQRVLAARYGVSQVNICHIKKGRIWKASTRRYKP